VVVWHHATVGKTGENFLVLTSGGFGSCVEGKVIHYPNWRLCGHILAGGKLLTPAINFVGRVKRLANKSVGGVVERAGERARVLRVCSVLDTDQRCRRIHLKEATGSGAIVVGVNKTHSAFLMRITRAVERSTSGSTLLPALFFFPTTRFHLECWVV